MARIRLTIFSKFSAVMVGLALFPVVFLSYELISINKRGVQEAVLELHTNLAEKLSEEIDHYLTAKDRNIGFALSSVQKRMGWADKDNLLRSVIESDSDISEISIIDLSRGQELWKGYNPAFSNDKALASRIWESSFKDFQKNGKQAISVETLNDVPILVIYYPINNKVCARVVLSLRRLGSLISSQRVAGTGFAVLVGSDGRPLLFDKDKLTSELAADFPSLAIVSSALQAQSVGSSEFKDHRTRYIGAYAPVAGFNGAVLILQKRSEAYWSFEEMKKTAYGMVAFVLFIGILLAMILARRLSKPLVALTRAAEAVAAGNFKVEVGIRTHDELQDLVDTFNTMVARLRAYTEMHVDQLIAEQQKTSAILYSINDGIVMVDSQGRFQSANRRAFEIFNLDPSQSIEGKTLEEVLPASNLRETVKKTIQTPDLKNFEEVDMSTDDRHFYLHVTSKPVLSPNKTSGGSVVVALHDVTLEKELDKMKEDFLQYITHDLRNPLSSAMGFLDELLKGRAGVLTSEQNEIAMGVKRTTLRLMSMINNILDIAKMESGGMRLNLKTTSIAGLASRSISVLESLAQRKKIKVNLQAGEEFSIHVDSDLIERVIVNLLGNAIKYTPEGGEVNIFVKDSGDSIQVCVSDNGEGIPKEYLERIFLKFEQVTGQRKGGTGLGLTIARYFVEAHHGRIWVESEVGKGAQFYFTLPKNLLGEKVS